MSRGSAPLNECSTRQDLEARILNHERLADTMNAKAAKSAKKTA